MFKIENCAKIKNIWQSLIRKDNKTKILQIKLLFTLPLATITLSTTLYFIAFINDQPTTTKCLQREYKILYSTNIYYYNNNKYNNEIKINFQLTEKMKENN